MIFISDVYASLAALQQYKIKHAALEKYELFTPDTPQIWVTAFEAVAGLIIEGVFIAMLAQHFFGK